MIAPTNTISAEWQNENSLRSYPVEENAPAAGMIPAWLISDLHVTADVRYSVVFISSVYISDTLLSVGISGYGDTGTVGLLTRTVTRDELESNRAYSMDALTDTAAGAISFGVPPADAANVKLTFSKDEAPIVASAIAPVKVPGITRIIDPAYGTEASGIIDLSGNSEFRTYVDPDDSHTIIVELVDMYRDMTTSTCVATPSFDTCGETPVKTIDGVPPDENGVIKLRFN